MTQATRDRIKALVDGWPPLTNEQKVKLRIILAGTTGRKAAAA